MYVDSTEYSPYTPFASHTAPRAAPRRQAPRPPVQLDAQRGRRRRRSRRRGAASVEPASADGGAAADGARSAREKPAAAHRAPRGPGRRLSSRLRDTSPRRAGGRTGARAEDILGAGREAGGGDAAAAVLCAHGAPGAVGRRAQVQLPAVARPQLRAARARQARDRVGKTLTLFSAAQIRRGRSSRAPPAPGHAPSRRLAGCSGGGRGRQREALQAPPHVHGAGRRAGAPCRRRRPPAAWRAPG